METTSTHPGALREAKQRGHGTGRVAEAERSLAPCRRPAAGGRAMCEDELLAVARAAFYRVQRAWASGALDEAEQVMTPEAHRAMTSELERLDQERGIFRHFEFQPAAVTMARAWPEEAPNWFQVRVTATLRDYVVDDFTGEMASWSRAEPFHVVEEWTFVRDAEGSWRVAAIA